MMADRPSIAVLGASANRSKYGNKCVRAYLDAGYRVVPVNPREDRIEGQEVVRRLAEIEGPLDRISVYLPPSLTLELVPEIAAAGAGAVWLNPGSSDDAVREALEAAGVPAVYACSIVDLGTSPARYP